MVRWVKRHYLVVCFVLVNLAIAAPVGAALDNDYCSDEGTLTPCCTSCLIFCVCDLT